MCAFIRVHNVYYDWVIHLSFPFFTLSALSGAFGRESLQILFVFFCRCGNASGRRKSNENAKTRCWPQGMVGQRGAKAYAPRTRHFASVAGVEMRACVTVTGCV